MILPNVASPLRPVIAAFYATCYQAQPGWEKHDYTRALRGILNANGSATTSPPTAAADLVIDERIGVVIVSDTRQLTDATRRRVRQSLAGDGLEVALIMAFSPQPRLARVDAPRRARGQAAPSSLEPPLYWRE